MLPGLFKVRDSVNDGKVYRLAIVQLLQAQQGGDRITDTQGLLKVLP